MTESSKYFHFNKQGDFKVETAKNNEVFDLGQLKVQYRTTPSLNQYKNGFSLLGVNNDRDLDQNLDQNSFNLVEDAFNF